MRDGAAGVGDGEVHAGSVTFAAPELVGVAGSEALVAAAQALASMDPRGLSEDERLGVLDDLERARRLVEAATGSFLVAVDSTGTTDIRFGHRTAVWASQRYGAPVGVFKTVLRDTRALMLRFPVLARAVASGQFPLVRAGVVCRHTTVRNLDALAAAQEAILALSAATRSFRRYADDIAALAAAADADGGLAPEPQASRLSMSRTGDELHLRGVLTGDLGREVEGVLSVWADRLFQQRRAEAALTADLPVPGRDEVQADALREVLRRGHAADTSTTRAPVTDVTLVVREPTPVDPGTPLWGRPRRCTDVRGIRFSAHTVELLACDPVVHALLVDAHDVPAALATAARFASDDQRRAAAVRDGGCVFPGCDAPPSWTDLHHVIHAKDDGPTELWNLASLCRRHHGVVHRRGWSMRTVEDQWFQFVSPSGAVVESQRHGRCRGRPPDPG